MLLVVKEIFRSVQGEGCNMGRPCVFVRLAGCNLRCSFCDTAHSVSLSEDMEVGEVVKHCRGMQLVVITGGEPTLQKEALERLITALQEEGHIVALESNGSYKDYTDFHCYVVVSPKRELMYSFVPDGVAELKYVVTDDFNADVAIPESVRKKFPGRIWLQPCDSGSEESIRKMWKKCYEIAMGDGRLRVGVQLHKWMGVE